MFKLFIGFVFALLISVSSTAQDTALPNNEQIEIPQVDRTLLLNEAVNALNASSFTKKTNAVNALVELKDPRILPILKGMRLGKLYSLKKNKTIVLAEKVEGGYQLTHAVTGSDLGIAKSNTIKKIRVNNKVRSALSKHIAILELTSSNTNERFLAAKNILSNPDEQLREVLVVAQKAEPTRKVKELISLIIARLDIQSSDENIRLNALRAMTGAVEPTVIQDIKKILEKDESGNYIEKSEVVTAMAEDKLSWIQTKLDWFKFCEDAIFGLSLGSVLLLAAIGLAITFGVMGVINMAHGEMIMLGAYTTFAVQQFFPSLMSYSLLIAIPMAFLVSGLVGVIIERTVIRHLYGRPLDTLLATFGISLILQQLVRVYNSNNVPVVTPDWMAGSLEINAALSFTYNRIYIFIFALMVLVGLALLLKKTLLGLQMRAVTQNRAMANSMGIRSGHIDALTFGLGSGIAGIAGVAVSQITNVGPNLGQSFIIDSFMVVVFGGVGNLLGTFFAAMGLGVVTKFLEPQVGTVVGKIMVLVFIILFIQFRPRGLFALKGRFVED